MAEAATVMAGARYPYSISFEEEINILAIENMRLGMYKSKTEMLRDAVKMLNKALKIGEKP